MRELLEEFGHNGREGTYFLLKGRAWWRGMYSDLSQYVRTCRECQYRAPVRIKEPVRAVVVTGLWRRAWMDIGYMPHSMGKSFLVVARCLLTLL